MAKSPNIRNIFNDPFRALGCIPAVIACVTPTPPNRFMRLVCVNFCSNNFEVETSALRTFHNSFLLMADNAQITVQTIGSS